MTCIFALNITSIVHLCISYNALHKKTLLNANYLYYNRSAYIMFRYCILFTRQFVIIVDFQQKLFKIYTKVFGHNY